MKLDESITKFKNVFGLNGLEQSFVVELNSSKMKHGEMEKNSISGTLCRVDDDYHHILKLH